MKYFKIEMIIGAVLLGSFSRANPSAGSLSAFFLSRTGTSDTGSADPSRFSYRLCFSDV